MQNQSHTVENSIPLIVLVGPTGIGKSDLSLKLSNYLNIELINVDSRQVYKGMEIGTASPTSEWSEPSIISNPFAPHSPRVSASSKDEPFF